ncbi:kinase-like domain-containing protein, partial [Rhodocollybia butyracea]
MTSDSDSEEYDSDEYPELFPNLDALSSLVSSSLNQQLTKPWTRLTRGLSHEIWVSQSDSGLQLVARLSRIEEDPRKLLSEVSTMDYVKRHTTILVPTVYLLEINHNNQVGMQYMIMERMPGVHLYKLWDELSLNHQISLIGDIANVLIQLASLEFPKIGMLDEEFNVRSFYALRKFSVAEPTEKPADHALFDDSQGPFSSTVEYLQAFIQRIRFYPGLPSAVSSALDEVHAIIRKYCHTHAQDSFLSPPFRLIHGDFDGQNILISRPTDKNPPCITAVIDWENSYVGPLYFLYEYPIFIQDMSWSREYYSRNAILRRHFAERLNVIDWFPRDKCSTLNTFRDVFILSGEY